MNSYKTLLPRKLPAILLGAIAIAVPLQGTAQVTHPDKPTVGKPITGAVGITETVAELMLREAENPAFYDGRTRVKPEPGELEFRKTAAPGAPALGQWPKSEAVKSGGGPSPLSPQPIGLNFLGVQKGDTVGYVPPDSNGDVGTTQIVVAANGIIRTFAKATGVADGALNITCDNFFASVRSGSSISDPQVRYDRLSGRWFIIGINVASPYRVCIAVSSGAVIANSASFTFYFISSTRGLADYPSLGVDNNALYIGCNMFNPSFLGTDAWVVRKTSVLSGGPIVATNFQNLATGAADGPFAARGVDNDSATATEGYFIGAGSISYGTLFMRRVSTPGGTPTLSGNIPVAGVLATNAPMSVPALGSTNPLSPVGDRLFYAQVRRNRLTNLTTLWTAHHCEVNASGVADAAGNRNGSRWYEIQTLTGAPSVRQVGTLRDTAATNPLSYWFPSVAMSGQGHMALGCSRAGAAARADVATAGRYSSDALGSIQAATQVTFTAAAYNAQATNPQRWGDYSMTRVDPVDDMTIWSFQEWCNAANSWGVQCFKLIAPPPAAISSLAPNTIAQGQTINIAVTGTSSASSGWFDTEAGMNRLLASFSGTGLTVNTVTFTNPTSCTLNVTASAGATLGLRNLTLTNPDLQTTTGTNVLTVTGTSNPVPTTTSIAPNVKNVGDPTFNMTVNGTNFIPTSVVRFNGSDRVTTYAAGVLTATIPASDMLVAGGYSITVFNPLPGGGTSNPQTFTVNTVFANVQPTALTVLPGIIIGGGGLPEVLAAEDLRLVVKPGAVFINTNPPIVAVLEGTAPFSSLTSMAVNFEGHASASNIQLVTFAWNFVTLGYDQIDTRLMSTADAAFSVNVPNPNDHKNGANLMRIKFTCRANSATFVYPWFSRMDMIGWTVGN